MNGRADIKSGQIWLAFFDRILIQDGILNLTSSEDECVWERFVGDRELAGSSSQDTPCGSYLTVEETGLILIPILLPGSYGFGTDSLNFLSVSCLIYKRGVKIASLLTQQDHLEGPVG